MENLDYSSVEDLDFGLDYDPAQSNQYTTYPQGSTWPPASMDQALSHNLSQDVGTRRQRANTMHTHTGQVADMAYSQSMSSAAAAAAFMVNNWQFDMSQAPQQTFIQTTGFDPQYQTTYGGDVQMSPVALMPPNSVPFSSAPLDGNLTSVSLNNSYVSMPATALEPTNQLAYLQLTNYQNDYVDLGMYHGLPSVPIGQPATYGTSYSDNQLEVRSLSSSDNGWANVEYPQARQSFDNYPEGSNVAVFNPGETLHHRSDSNVSLRSEGVIPGSEHSVGSFEEVIWPMSSPASEGNLEFPPYHGESHMVTPHFEHHTQYQYQPQQPIAPSNMMDTMSGAHSYTSSASTSPASTGSNMIVARRREGSASKVIKSAVDKKKAVQKGKKDVIVDKKVGKRKGPLRPDQRKSAGEIRKIKACLRCKFLKKTCDKGDPCGGCQPAHTRLWQVPCTRIDIKEINYFMKDWKADYERHVTLGFTIANIKGWSPHETPVFITHGYGPYLRIAAREVYVRDTTCFSMDWSEGQGGPAMLHYEVDTARLSLGAEGIRLEELSKYLDKHIDDGFEGFERWIDGYFQEIPFFTEMLKTAYRYYRRSNLPIVRKALKLIIAYTLTLSVTMIEGHEEGQLVGKIEDERSRYYGKTMAPVMINFQIKDAMGKLWREYQKDVLEELSSLYTGVYSGERPKNWPIIFILGMILLMVWEMMQFDCHYRVPDKEAVSKFCTDMEAVPVGVVVGLFFAISQKFPAFTQWDTREHAKLLADNPASCDTMTEVREHVTKYDDYLKNRTNCKFVRDDFDSLSNKFLSKLVIRAN